MVKAAELLVEDQVAEQRANIVIGDSDGEDDDEDILDVGMQDTLDDEEEARLVRAVEAVELAPEMTASCIRCAAHTLNLAINDCLKAEKCREFLVKVRTLVKKLRTPRLVRLQNLPLYQLRSPVLDMPTRWSSTATMLESLLPLQAFAMQYVSNPDSNAHIDFTEADFVELKAMVEALLPAKLTMTELQGEQLTMGDFLGSWLRCRTGTKNVQSDLAQKLHERMAVRETKLFENPAFAAAIYLDPQFSKLLPSNMLVTAEGHIQKVWGSLQRLKGTPPETPEPAAITEETVDELVQILMEYDMAPELNGSSNARLIIPLAQEFRRMPRNNASRNVLEYWECRKYTNPELYAVAQVVLAAPATQVSVERLFSGVKFVLSDQRLNLKSSVLDHIMIIRTNTIFLKKADMAPSTPQQLADASGRSNQMVTPTSAGPSSRRALRYSNGNDIYEFTEDDEGPSTTSGRSTSSESRVSS